jgi:hypothetical protein
MDGPVPSDMGERRALATALLRPRDEARLAWLRRRLPRSWSDTRRRRRLLFLGLAAPGFFAVFGTTLHHNFFLMLAGFVLFAAAVIFRLRTEPLFERVATGLPPLPDPLNASTKDTRHASSIVDERRYRGFGIRDGRRHTAPRAGANYGH